MRRTSGRTWMPISPACAPPSGSAVCAVSGGAIAWLALGRRDPLATVWEHRDEREAVAG